LNGSASALITYNVLINNGKALKKQKIKPIYFQQNTTTFISGRNKPSILPYKKDLFVSNDSSFDLVTDGSANPFIEK
jgi:hypothetical protein